MKKRKQEIDSYPRVICRVTDCKYNGYLHNLTKGENGHFVCMLKSDIEILSFTFGGYCAWHTKRN